MNQKTCCADFNTSVKRDAFYFESSVYKMSTEDRDEYKSMVLTFCPFCGCRLESIPAPLTTLDSEDTEK